MRKRKGISTKEFLKFLKKAMAEYLVKEGIYSTFDEAIKALKRGHREGGKCPITQRPFHKTIVYLQPNPHIKLRPGLPSGQRCGKATTICSECFKPLKRSRKRPVIQK